MAQNEGQGIEAAGRRGGGTADAATEGSGSTGSTGSTPPPVTGKAEADQVRVERTSPGKDQSEGRLSRREGWDDFTGFFGGSPFALFRRLSEDMDRLFFGSGGQGLGTLSGFGARFLPHVDVSERDGKLLINADLPGVRLEDFRVEVEDQALVLEGERKNQQEDTRGGVRRLERTYGSFRRVIPLPPGTNVDAAQARFDNGVLEITIPLQQEARTRRLEVQSGGTGGATGGDTTKH
jgi:HSP20 family protein